ncbi:NEL-type E3 ubiquitin ligase domain-containing protein [Pseudomonas synxantha]|uniref:NEL-type E3 ubiquitin ligase domain-containing protein n=1 Tax=Pseudomonas synxantha TaxID=47883 RepID=UPI0006144D0A|nr:NEL-type E3 ubiquitin ligase domain-containing protein [Pseudomonas synxantha]
MSEQPVTPPPEGTFNVDLRGVHYDFLKERVPAWFNQATAQRQQELADHELELPGWYLIATAQQKADLADNHRRYRETLNQVEEHLGQIEDVLAFAEQPLKDAIKTRFKMELDVRNVYFARKYGFKSRDDLYGAFVFDQQGDPAQRYEYRGVSLLEAALANFAPDEERAGACADCQVITTWRGFDSDIIPTPSVIQAHALAIPGHEFARLCRSLDLGKRYQQHIKDIVQPTDDTQRSALERQLEEHHRQQLALSAEVAVQTREWGIGADVYRMLKHVITDPGSARLDGKPVTFAALKIFGCVLVGPLLIGPGRKDSDRVERLVVFIPNDPQQPLKEYASSGDFMADLRTRLHSLSYRRFFSRFVPQREQGMFFQQFDRLYKPANGNGAAGDYPLAAKPARLPLDELAIGASLWQALREAQVRKILADARAVAVPTGDEDRQARLDRLASYLDAVISAFNLAAFVVPGLGPTMLAVAVLQMCAEGFEGIEAYEQGDLKTMWAHFSSVALNAAFIGTGAKVLPEVKLSSVVDNLKPVTLPTGKQVLWNPDLTPYKISVQLPADTQPDALGLYHHNGQALLPHEGDHYQVRQEPETGRYRIQHPSRPGAYEPLLEHNHAGAWSHEVEEPLTWDLPTLIRRLGLQQRGFDSDTLEQARLASGVEEDTLRQSFVEHEPVPLVLEDTLQHFKAHQHLSTFVEQMRSIEPALQAQADPVLQLQIMRRGGMLPVDIALRVVSDGARVVWEEPLWAGASRHVVVVTENQLAGGQLLKEVLHTLQGVDPNLETIPGSPEESLAVRADKVRESIATIVDTFKGSLVEERYKTLTASDDPDVRLVQGTYPKLPTSMAAELLTSLTDEQLQAFRNSGILPEAQREQARWFEQEIRVSRAYEGLHLDTLTDLDSQRLALRTLETLSGWRRGTRVELRQYSAEGSLLDAIGSPDSTQRKTLVLKANGVFDAPMPRDFYTATWAQLSSVERQALGFTDALQMKAAIRHAPLPRQPLRTVLLEHPLRKPTVEPGLRLLGGGRGFRRLLERMTGPSQASAKARAKVLFPSMGDDELDTFILSLGSDVRGGLARYKAQLQTLQAELATWVQANASSATAHDQTPAYRVSQEIERAWRRMGSGTLRLLMRDLELPPLSADFSHVQRLDLYGVKWSSQADTFLQTFTGLKDLSVRKSGLTELPAAIGNMPDLTSLDLSANNIRLTAQSARMLSGLGKLETLRLTGNRLGIAPDFSAMPRLKQLNLRGAQLEQWPAGLTACPELEVVDLSHNQLREVPVQYLNPAPEQLEETARVNGVTLLEGNPFPPGYWKQFDNYWKRLAEARSPVVTSAREGAFDSGNPRLAKVRRMYPNKRTHEARAWMWLLGEEADVTLARLEGEFNTLERQLNAWTFSGGAERQRYVRAGERRANTENLDDRFQAQQRILACWRGETPQKLSNDGQPIGLELDLSRLTLPSLPDLDVDFSQVGSLKLSNMQLSASPEGFLARFRHLRWLDLSSNQLRELPPALGEMPNLTRLFLNNNQIRLTPDTAQILSERVTLRAIWLHDNALGIAPDFSRITDLRTLSMNHAGLEHWPAGLAQQPDLGQVDLRNNNITTIPASVTVPAMERVNNVTTVSGNPLTEDTLRQVRDYSQQLGGRRNLLVYTALVTRVPIGPDLATRQAFGRWVQDLPATQLPARMAQWVRLGREEGAHPFFDILNRLEPAGAGYADLQRRVWEVIDSVTENTAQSDSHRKEVFDRAGAPGCCDLAAFSFSNLETLTLVYRARAQAAGQMQAAQLASLSKGLLRLHEVDKIASADIQRSEAIVNDPSMSMTDKLPHTQRLAEEVEIRLAYRFGLKDRLQLPGQPQKVRFTSMGGVTPAMLDAAYEKVIALDNSAEEFQALLSREFWQDYVTHKYRAQFDRLSEPYQQQLAALHDQRVAEALSDALYEARADELQARLVIEESGLIETLSRREIAEALLPRGPLEGLVEPGVGPAAGLQLNQAQAIDLDGKQYFIASMPDARDGEYYVLWVQAAQNPFALVSSGIVAKPDLDGVWKRRGSAGGMRSGSSSDELEEASESMPVEPYTALELSAMKREVHFTQLRNVPGSYDRVNNGRYPLRNLQGKPMRIRKLQREVVTDSGVKYSSEQIKPYIQFEGYEKVAARYDEKLQRRVFTAQDMQVPEEKVLIGQSMVVANRRIAKGEILGVYGGTVLPSQVASPGGQTYIMLAGARPTPGKLGMEPIEISGDNILSRINTHFEYDANGKPVRQAASGYNVEGVGFDVEVEDGQGAKSTRSTMILTAIFAIEDIPAGVELRMDYQYSEGMIATLFA